MADATTRRITYQDLMQRGWTVHSATLYGEEGVEGWQWTAPDGREFTVVGEWSEPPDVPDEVAATWRDEPTAGYTPGPWYAVEHTGAEWTIQNRPAAGLCIAQKYGDSSLANARLISAAPDLLAACEEAIRCLDVTEWAGVPAYEQIKAAVAKATGQP